MATGVLMNNLPTPHNSNSVSQTTSGTGPSTLDVQPQSISGTRVTPDDVVDRLVLKAKSPLGEGEVRKAVETLGEMLQPHFQMSLRTRRRCLRGLVRICGEYGVLPNSYIIPQSKIQKLGDSPISLGGFSRVWAGMYEEDQSVAIKVIRRRESDDVRKIEKNFCREVIVWKRLSHPNILELIGVTMGDGEYTMVSPWMENGNIVEFLRENPEANPLKLLEDATRGLQYLHSIELAHGDIKGANILISDDGSACLADVGLTRVAGDLNSPTTTPTTPATPCGATTLRWSPPELLDPERFGSKGGGPTKKSDIYSMAMTIYEVLTDRPPFYEYKGLVIMYSILQGVRPGAPAFVVTRGYTEELWELTTICWREDSNERPTVDYVLTVLKSSAEQRKPKHEEVSILSPTDDPDSPIAPEDESGPVTFTTSASFRSPQPPVIKAPVPLARAYPHSLRSRTFDCKECVTAQSCSCYPPKGERERAHVIPSKVKEPRQILEEVVSQ